MPEGHFIFCLNTKNETKKVKASQITFKIQFLIAKVKELTSFKQLFLFNAPCGCILEDYLQGQSTKFTFNNFTIVSLPPMEYESYDIKFNQGTSKIHRFYNKTGGPPIFLIHGYFEDGRIFFTKKGKGFAPFLAKNGFDVFVCDLLGKGESFPKVDKNFKHSQFEIITRDIPTYIAFVREKTGIEKIHLGAHSWGGVVAIAYLSRTQDPNIKSMIAFSTKRRIAIKGWRKLIGVNLMWDKYGTYLTKKHGYLPAKKMKMGTENEPAAYYTDANIWVKGKKWISPEDGYNYQQELANMKLPPILYITGRGDKLLGHPDDVKRLLNETGKHQVNKLQIVGKNNGFKHDYDHINILTHKDAPKDHFPFVLDYLKQFE